LTSTRPWKILHVIDKLSMDAVNPSSCAHLIRQWHDHIDADRFSMAVCTLRGEDAGGRWLEEAGITVHRLGFGRYSPRNVEGIRAALAREGADLLHLHGYTAANMGRIAARRAGVPNIVHEHAILRTLPHQFVADFLLRRLTSAAVAVSSGVREFMIRGRSVPADKIRVIPNGVDTGRFRRLAGWLRHEKRRQLGIAQACPVVGTVTRLRAEKGNRYFILAMRAVMERFPDVIFVVVGDGPQKGLLEDLAAATGVSGRVRFLGFRRDVVELYSIMDIAVFPSLREGSPLAMMEAMAVGLPIVCSRVSGFLEAAGGADSALFVEPASAIDLAEKITHLLLNPQAAVSLAQRAGAVAADHDIRRATQALCQLYAEVLEDPRAAAGAAIDGAAPSMSVHTGRSEW
jgi:glycosyltransferase involved in cell wall biosynthesis